MKKEPYFGLTTFVVGKKNKVVVTRGTPANAVNIQEFLDKTGPRSVAIPREHWPIWAKALALKAKPQDKGIGDVVARTIGKENSARFEKWHRKIFGKECKCTGRRSLWNALYPLLTSQDEQSKSSSGTRPQ